MAERSVLVRLRADISEFNRKMAEAATGTKAFAERLDSADSRMANIIQTSLALGPALVPIGAVAVPAVVGLTEQLGFAALAAGTTVLAFQGIGKALTALQTYQLEPTQAHFQKLQETMDAVGPAGAQFVLTLDEMRPKLQELQNVAAAGMFPGLVDGLDQMLTLMPQAKDIIHTVSTTLGGLVAEAGGNLAGPGWTGFFDYIKTTAGPTLVEMGRTFGNVFQGLTQIIMAFDPLSRDFSAGMLRMSQSFNEWATGLSQTQGFGEFVTYIRESTPKVIDALGSLANAIVQIVEAAAPVGDKVLPIISGLADVLAAVANSPAGPVLISAAAAIGVLGRSMAILRTVGLRGDGESLIAKTLGTKEIKQSLPSLREVGTVMYSAGQASKYASDKTLLARQSMGQFVRSAAPATAAIGGVVLATTGLADKTGLANTASLGLMGTLMGPWGAALGAGAGFAMDLAAANNDLESAIKAADRAAQSLNLSQQLDTYADLTKQADEYNKTVSNLFSMHPTEASSFKDFLTGTGDLFTHSGEEAKKAAAEHQIAFSSMLVGLSHVQDNLNGFTYWDKIRQGAELTTPSLESYQRTLNTVSAAFGAVGRSSDDVERFLKSEVNSDAWREGSALVRDYVTSLDSMPGRSKAVGAALADLSGEMESNVTQADALKNAMDALFGVQLSQSEAVDAWFAGLADLRKELAKTNGAITGQTKAARDNREAIRGSVQNLQDRVAADAAAGVSGDKLVDSLLRGRKAIIDTAVAAGANRGKVAGYLKELGLTPKNLRTIITTPGLLTAKQQVQALGRFYGLTPKQIATLVKQPGMGKSNDDIRTLLRNYHLTPKQVQTLIKLLGADSAIGKVSALRGIYANLPRTIVTDIITNHYDKFDRATGGKPSAAGNIFSAYAAGDVRNAHQPQIAPGRNQVRVWAEEETLGESYIPHANDWRRPRAIAIWEETGRILGLQFQRYAAGGVQPAAQYAPRPIYMPAPTTPSLAGLTISGRLRTSQGMAELTGTIVGDAVANDRAYRKTTGGR